MLWLHNELLGNPTVSKQSSKYKMKGGPSMNLYVCLDVSSEKLDVCFLSDDANLTILETTLKKFDFGRV